MIRIAVADIPDQRVVRIDGFTLILRPALVDRDESVALAQLLLTPEEASMIRAALGVKADQPGQTCAERYSGVCPPVSCPCYIPMAIRSPLDDTPCPLHSDIAAAIEAVA